MTDAATSASTETWDVPAGRGRHVLVTDAWRGSALACIRSLGAAGWRVTAADASPGSPGFRSRFVTGRLPYPDPTRDGPGAAAAIIAAAERTGVDLILPITDEVGIPLAAVRDRVPPSVRIALPPDHAFAVARDKGRTLALGERLGVPVPPTRSARDVDEALAAAPDLGWPLVVKPVESRSLRPDGSMRATTVAYASDERSLRAILDGLGPDAPVLLQAWAPGVGVGVELLAHEGRVLAAFQHRRIREVPVTGGASALRESMTLDPALLEHASRLIEALGWTGLAMVEFRLTPGGPWLMEINGRVWGSLPLAVAAGMDFPARWAALVLDGPPPRGTPPVMSYRTGVRARNLRLEVSWIGGVLAGRGAGGSPAPFPARREAIGAALSLLDPRIRDDVLSRADPGPGAATLVDLVRHAARRLVERAA